MHRRRVRRPAPDRYGGRHADRHGIVDRAASRPCAQLAPWTATRRSPTRRTATGKLDPAAARLPSPIEHVIYIVKENRTYDQVLGDLKEGNGDPSLVLFGENVTPNHHKLAREFVLLDNFYVNCRCQRRRAQLVHRRHRAGLRAEDVAQQLRRPAQALRLRRAGAGRAAARRLSLDQRRRGRRLDAQLRLLGQQQAQRRARRRSRSPACATRCWPRSPTRSYRGFDLDYPDVERAKVFLDGPRRVREDRQDAAADPDAPGQRPHLRHRRRARSRRSPPSPTTTTRSA